jgi:ABC-type glycerol-3-phosphate transport system substrate-binding protein
MTLSFFQIFAGLLSVRAVVLLTGALLLAACAPGQMVFVTESAITEVLLTSTPVAQAPTQPQPPTPTFDAQPLAPTNMVIWWPEPIAPVNNEAAALLREDQVGDFQTAQGNVIVQIRLKMASDLGGILSTLRAASPVAPGALPDLTLMRREDLLIAAQAGLIYPLEGHLSSAILGDLYRAGLSLGQIDGVLYGLPYLLEAQHMAYRPLDAQPPSRFADFLAEQLTFALPAAQANRLSSVLMTQYLDAGGAIGESGTIELNPEALLTTLQFYEEAVALNLIDPAVLNYVTSADYTGNILAGTLDGGLVTSTQYLNLLGTGASLDFGPVPTASGTVTGEINGWLWVMTTSSADRQALAARFLVWMMNAPRQGEYSRAINMLPSQRTALQTWPESAYLTFIRQLFNNARLPLSDAEGGAVARAAQNALVAVLSGETTAEQALADLVERAEP